MRRTSLERPGYTMANRPAAKRLKISDSKPHAHSRVDVSTTRNAPSTSYFGFLKGLIWSPPPSGRLGSLPPDALRLINGFGGKALKDVSVPLREALRGMDLNLNYKVTDCNIYRVIEALSLLTPEHNTERRRLTIPCFTNMIQAHFRKLCNATDFLFHMIVIFPGTRTAQYQQVMTRRILFCEAYNHCEPSDEHHAKLNEVTNVRDEKRMITDAIDGLMCATALQSLHLEFNLVDVENEGVRHLSRIKKHPRMHTLHLKLPTSSIRNAGVQYLSELRDMPLLHTLRLDLSFNHIDHIGAGSLALFNKSHTLCILHLDLSACDIGDAGARLLAELYSAPVLRSLHLGLARCNLSNNAVFALEKLKDSPGLQTLHLDLRDNQRIDFVGHSVFPRLGFALGHAGGYLTVQWERYVEWEPHLDCFGYRNISHISVRYSNTSCVRDVLSVT
jgi:hypothetical protein